MCKSERKSIEMTVRKLETYRYREQAAKDAEHVHRHAHTLLKDRGWPTDLINENDTKLFCKHSSYLRLVRGTSLAAELDAKQALGDVDISKTFFIIGIIM